MYAQATIRTVVETSYTPKKAVRVLDAFMKLYAPVFDELNAYLLELGDGRMLTPEELAPILDRFRGELPVESAHIEDGAFAKDGADGAAAKKARGDLARVLSNLKRLLNKHDLERANGGGQAAKERAKLADAEQALAQLSEQRARIASL